MIIGRKTEIQRLDRAYCSKEAEFMVIHGRRRVGKTFLIREFFAQRKCVSLQVTGLNKGNLKQQLSNFAVEFAKSFTNDIPIQVPNSWDEAFKLLNQQVRNSKIEHKIVIFLDELPWMATPRSGLLQAIDYHWNHNWSRDQRIILIVCGSNASWLIKNIIYDTGGLHNRCTVEIKLAPFNLSEAEEFLISRGVKLNKNHILDLYMIFGGIPYYLKYIENSLTAAENVQNILFNKNALLHDEFKKLFNSLFKDAGHYIDLIKLIAKKKDGMSRSEIETEISLGGGRLSERLEKLQHTDFIARYTPWNKKNGEYYKVIDEFCLFYLNWLEATQGATLTSAHWLQQIQKPIYHVWAGYAFEAVCHKHIEQIIRALHIKSAESISSWRLVSKNKSEHGAQIDLLIDRLDDAITICEIKYTSSTFTITKAYADNLTNKIVVFKNSTKTHKQIFLALISANGVQSNQYSNELLSGTVVLEDLFKVV